MTIAALKSQTAPPPAPTAQSVRAHKRTLMLALDALRAGAPALVLEAARGAFGARDALINLCSKIEAIEFELSYHDAAVSLAMAEDSAAEAAWRAKVLELPADEIVSSISKGRCCDLCSPGTFCAITAPDKNAGGSCGHPLLTRDQQFLDETGRRHFRYEANPRAAEIYRAACRKLKVSS